MMLIIVDIRELPFFSACRCFFIVKVDSSVIYRQEASYVTNIVEVDGFGFSGIPDFKLWHV